MDPASQLVADQLPFPLKVAGEDVVDLTAAPGAGEHTEAVLAAVLGYDADKIAALRAAGALGGE